MMTRILQGKIDKKKKEKKQRNITYIYLKIFFGGEYSWFTMLLVSDVQQI